MPRRNHLMIKIAHNGSILSITFCMQQMSHTNSLRVPILSIGFSMQQKSYPDSLRVPILSIRFCMQQKSYTDSLPEPIFFSGSRNPTNKPYHYRQILHLMLKYACNSVRLSIRWEMGICIKVSKFRITRQSLCLIQGVTVSFEG